MNEIIVGIDLGTTFSLVAYIDRSGEPCVIRNALGSFSTPSVVWLKGDTVLVGNEALSGEKVEPEKFLRNVKRVMGDRTWSFYNLTPVEISAKILSKLKKEAESKLNCIVNKACITVPAYFSPPAIEDTQKAGELAGLKVLDIPKEPTAAALYLLRNRNIADGQIVMVFDIGGGTTDISILKVMSLSQKNHYKFELLASDGDVKLGGINWTMRMLENIESEFKNLTGNKFDLFKGLYYQVLDQCEKAKCDLAEMENTTVDFEINNSKFSFPISREDFSKFTNDLVYKAIAHADNAIKLSHLHGWKDISFVLLTGGSSRLLQVQQSLSRLVGNRLIVTEDPDQAIALGAAFYTKMYFDENKQKSIPYKKTPTSIVEIKLVEKTNFGFATIVKDFSFEKFYSSVIIPRGSEIPIKLTQGKQQKYCIPQGSNKVIIPVVHADSDGISPLDCVFNCVYFCTCSPAARDNLPVEVTFEYTHTGIANVEISSEVTEYKLTTEKTSIRTWKEIEDLLNQKQPALSDANVVLVLDVSGSMGINNALPLTLAKQEIIKIANCIVKEKLNVNLGLIKFSSSAEILVSMQKINKKFTSQVESLAPEASTNMVSALDTANQMFNDQNCTGLAILISDGQPDDPPKTIEAALRLKNSDVKLYVISIGEEGRDFLRSLGDEFQGLDRIESLADSIMPIIRKATDLNVRKS